MLFKAVLRSCRVPFLVLPPICILLAATAAGQLGAGFPVPTLLLVLTAALAAHISVNALNEYEDFHSGLDLHTQRTPFSGGSGSLPEQPAAGPWVLATGIGTLLLTLMIGVHFVSLHGWPLALMGGLGALLILTYTRWLNRSPWLCLLAPGCGFALITFASYWVLNPQWHPAALWLTAMVFCLVNNLLLLNQYPDIEADRRTGRYHAPIAWGIPRSNGLYTGFLALACLSLLAGVASNALPVFTLAGLLALPLGLFALSGARRHGANLGQHPKHLAANVGTCLLMPLLASLGWLLA